MNSEEMIIHCFRAFLIGISLMIFLGVWKYLQKKALGMETLYDLMIKDAIIMMILKMVSTQLVLFKFVETYEYHLAFAIVLFDYICIWASVCHILATILIRYFSIFHQNLLESFEDMNVIIAIRIINFLVGIYMSMPWVIHISEGVMFYNLTNQNMDNADLSHAKYFKILVAIVIFTVIFVQIKIELFEMKVKVHPMTNTSTEITYSKCTIRFVILLLLVFLSFLFFWLSSIRSTVENVALSRLKLHLLIQIVVCILIPLTLIYRNKNMREFFKEKMLSNLRYFYNSDQTPRPNMIDVIV